jgi:hypothetical protein
MMTGLLKARSFTSSAALVLLLLHYGGGTTQAATRIHNQIVTPSTLVFLATDPDTPLVPGNVSASVAFRTTGGSTANTWRVEVQATGGGNMLNCPNSIPVSRIRVTCVAATAEGGTAACGAPFALSTALQTVATGTEGSGNARPYTITLNFTFQDSWQYIATNTPCAVNLSYRITAN